MQPIPTEGPPGVVLLVMIAGLSLYDVRAESPVVAHRINGV
jgi:hypothetical protein